MDEISIRLGESMEVRLQSLSTAGYMWKVKNDNSDIVTIEQVIHDAGFENLAAGKSNDQVYAIRALHKGEATILFQQKRSWEETVLKEKTYLIKVS